MPARVLLRRGPHALPKSRHQPRLRLLDLLPTIKVALNPKPLRACEGAAEEAPHARPKGRHQPRLRLPPHRPPGLVRQQRRHLFRRDLRAPDVCHHHLRIRTAQAQGIDSGYGLGILDQGIGSGYWIRVLARDIGSGYRPPSVRRRGQQKCRAR